MKILSIGNFWKGWDGSICDEEHIAKSLEDLGHIVQREQREDFIKNQIVKDTKFDFILLAQWNNYPSGICKNLRNIYCCPIVYWAFDYQFDSNENWHFEMAKEADLFLSKEMNNREFYKYNGCKFRWLPQDFAPEFYDKSPAEKIYDVSFAGTYLPQAKDRIEYLKAIDNKFNLHIFSVTPEDWKKIGFKNIHLSRVDTNNPFNQTKINISIDWKTNAEGYWSDRLAQIMCYEEFVLNKYIPLQEIVFRDYVIHFHTIDECLEKIDYYLKHPEERNKIAERAYKYAQENLKVKNRVKDMLSIIKNEFACG